MHHPEYTYIIKSRLDFSIPFPFLIDQYMVFKFTGNKYAVYYEFKSNEKKVKDNTFILCSLLESGKICLE